LIYDLRSRILDMTSPFQDGGHDVRPPLAAAYAAVSASCPLARPARVCMQFLIHRIRYFVLSCRIVILTVDIKIASRCRRTLRGEGHSAAGWA